MGTTLAVLTASLALSAAAVSSSAAAGTVTINAPVAPQAGTVELTGSVGVGAGEVTTVLYVFDATSSTASPDKADCSGNGTVDADDDLNKDGTEGDILDCEIVGVEALSSSLSTTAGLQVGLVAFGNEAAAADLDPAGTATFIHPGFTGGDPRPRINTVARSVVEDNIRLYDHKGLGGSGAGTAFNSAISVALSTLATAPAGPKWIMFLSDGQAPIDDSRLEQLKQSGVRLRSFGIGAEAKCAPSGSLYKMAAATGESCQLVPQPSSLAAGLTGSQPDAVSSVTVSIDNVSVAATVDAVGGWVARFTLGAGTYTATVKAILASGATHSAKRTFTVASAAGAPAPGAPGAPPPGTVAAGPGSLKATMVKVDQPEATRDVLPSRVTGRIGVPVDGLTVVPALAGSEVLLQARAAAGAPWSTVDRDQVDNAGKFALKWRPKARLSLLRVELLPRGGYAGSAATVPTAKISACKVKGKGGKWSLTCRTTAKKGSQVRLLKGGKVIDRAKVRRGSLRVSGKGSVGAHTLDVKVSKRRHIRLNL